MMKHLLRKANALCKIIRQAREAVAAADPQQTDPILCVGACGDYATGPDLLCDDCRADWELQEAPRLQPPPDPHPDVVLDVDESVPCDGDPLDLWPAGPTGDPRDIPF